jgi:hypothetical protein
VVLLPVRKTKPPPPHHVITFNAVQSNLIFGMQPMITQLEEIWKTTSIFLKTEDDLNIFEKGRRPQFFSMKDDFNLFSNERGHHILQMKYNLNIIANGRKHKKKIMQPETIKIRSCSASRNF